MLTIKIPKNPHGDRKNLFKYNEIDLKPGVTVLIGCNGSGKSTILNTLRKYCEENEIKHIMFDNLRNGGRERIGLDTYYGEFMKVAGDLISSEGERISNNIAAEARKIGEMVRNCKKGEKFFILMDAIDSGYSIDNIVETKKDLFDVIVEDSEKRGIEAYIVVSANEYEMCDGYECIDVSTNQHYKNLNYRKYKNIILKSRVKKNKRYNWAPFYFGMTDGQRQKEQRRRAVKLLEEDGEDADIILEKGSFDFRNTAGFKEYERMNDEKFLEALLENAEIGEE